jgi:hypothetical protein
LSEQAIVAVLNKLDDGFSAEHGCQLYSARESRRRMLAS